jgi:hypothetical protein
MKTRLHRQLLQQAMDGTLSDKDKEQWQKLSRNNPDLAQEFKSQQEMASLLNNVPMVQPPAHLAEAILKTVQINKASRSAIKNNRFRMPEINIKYVYAFTAGLAIGLLLLFVLSNDLLKSPSMQNSQLSGTLYLASEWHSQPIATAELQGKISWKSEPTALAIQLSLNPQVAARVEFDYAKTNMQMSGFSDENTTAVQEIHAGSGKFTLQVTSPCQFQVTLTGRADPSAPVCLSIIQNDEITFTYQLQ